MEDEQYGNTGIPCIENSYKMIPDATFNTERARGLAEEVLLCIFYGVKKLGRQNANSLRYKPRRS